MTIEVLPVWTIPPDWSDPVTESLEWLTGILASVTGVEQRQALRLSPRRSLEFTVRPTGSWRTWYDALLSVPSQRRYWVPVWHEVGRLKGLAAAGMTSLTVSGARAELAGAEVLYLQGSQPWQYELAEVASSVVGADTVFHLVAGLATAWPRGTRVFPAATAMVGEQPAYNRLADRTLASSVRFDLTQVNDWVPASGLPDYRGFPVVDLPTNEGDAQSGGYERIVADLDSQTGVRERADLGAAPFQKFGASNFFRGRVNSDSFRALLYMLRGRLAAVWVVYPMADFRLVLPAALAAASITVERGGYTDLGTPVAGRQDIRILLRDGSAYHHRITGSAIIGDGATESLSLNPVLSSALTPASVLRISFMGLGRLDQDRVELTHRTDTDGVCGVSLAVKAVPDLRVAVDWEPPALPVAPPPTWFFAYLEPGAGPDSTVVITDWARGFVYLWDDGPIGVRKYTVSLSTHGPVLSATLPETQMFCGDIDPVSGCLVASVSDGAFVNGKPINKYDPDTLITTGSFGAPDSVPSYPASVWLAQSLVCVECDGVGYALAKENVFSGYVAAIRIDDMTAAGFYEEIVTGTTNNRGIMCRGASGSAGASVFLTWEAVHQTTTLPLYTIVILPGPSFSWDTIGTFAAGDVDPAWTTMQCDSIGYDQADGNVLMALSTTNAVTNKNYLVKLNASTAAVMWTLVVAANFVDLARSRIVGTMTLLRVGGVDIVDTVAGTALSTTLSGTPFASHVSDAGSGLVLTHGAMTVTDLSPAPGTSLPLVGWVFIGAPRC